LCVSARLAVLLLMPTGALWRPTEDKFLPIGRGGGPRVNRAVEVQGAFDQTKPWGLGQQAPLTPEYEGVLRDSWTDQRTAGSAITDRPLPAERHAAHHDIRVHEYVITPEHLTCSPVGITCAGFLPTSRLAPKFRSRPMAAIPSADGSRGRRREIDVLEPSRVTSRSSGPSTRAGLPLAFDNQSSSRSGSLSTK